MAKVVVLGAGVSGLTAISFLRKSLSSEHEVIMGSPNSNYQWVPSNIWIGIGRLKPEQAIFPLAPLYKRKNIKFVQAKVTSFHPEGDKNHSKGFVKAEYVIGKNKGQEVDVDYDFLVNATGPKLNFEATPGLKPGTFGTTSVCTYDHATHAWNDLHAIIKRMKKGLTSKSLLALDMQNLHFSTGLCEIP